MTVSELLEDIRLELADEAKTRWSDQQILKAVAKAYRRLSHVLYRNDVELGRAVHVFLAEPGRADYPLPADFMADYGLYRDDTHARLTKHGDDSWQQLAAPAECSAWIVRGDSLLLAAAPSSAKALTLIYWPLVDLEGLDMDAPTPFDGKLDDIVAEYAALRLKNIDEMDVAQDGQLLQDMENNLLNTYSAISPVTVTRRGWLA
ncbi:hypothetical protein NNJEOMEG_03870 [Fundidesulfovibrio magnetotacticus]|uniref:Uncharacterized protein n=1 Tax=Fundidesulfovibrio magnetotacticus TaxID=2730080 RepID=A0A6V8M236_9BACT|nr:hypothetical protein [Fundidesulfovibrio magnetotacticus]GFK95996.1 hypothetical protein NNJEOMEG_03870 [Fundidesulfovibrio magnetotacticus]